MRVLTIGGATYDIFIDYAARTCVIDEQPSIFLPAGQKIDLDAVSYYSGGGATNSAASFARLGFCASSFFKIGNDCAGLFIVDQLQKESIITHQVISETEKTSCSFILPCPSGDKTILVYRGANNTITKDEIPVDLIVQHDLIYISSLGGSTAQLLPDIVRIAHENKILVAVNPGGSQLKFARSLYDALSFIDILILNSYEAQLFMGYPVRPAKPAVTRKSEGWEFIEGWLTTFFETVFARGTKIAVVTDGANGVYVASPAHAPNKILFHPSAPVQPVSTVGAGDAFGSCFVAQLAQGKSIGDAMRAGIANSGSVIMHVGAKTGLLHQADLDKKIGEMDQNLLQELSCTGGSYDKK